MSIVLPPLIRLTIEPIAFTDVDLPSYEGLTDEAISRLESALLAAGFKVIDGPEYLGIGM